MVSTSDKTERTCCRLHRWSRWHCQHVAGSVELFDTGRRVSPLKLGRAPAVEIQYQLHQPKSLADRVGKVLDVGGVCADQDAHTYSNNMLFIVLIIIFPLAD